MRSALLRTCALLGVAFLLLPCAAAAQETGAGTGAVTGTVTDSVTGEPLPGVNVLVEGTESGGATDAQGVYEITGVEPGTYTVTASFVGYGDKSEEGVQVQAGQASTVSFAMRPQAQSLDEVVVVGYGTQERRDVTGSVGSIDVSEETQDVTVTNVAQLLQGRVAGLEAGVGTEADGGSSGGLQVRGANSITASTDPLIVLDGVRYDGSLQDINPYDIQSIDVLKGASAAAVYGASAASGVIEVTTKSGSTPEPTIRFKSSLGVATRGRYMEPYGVEGYVQYRRDAAARLNPGAPENLYTRPENLPGDVTVEEWLALGGDESTDRSSTEVWLSRIGLVGTEIQNYMEGNSVNWADQVVRERALRQNYNLSVSGAPEDVSYYVSLGYTDNEAENYGNRFRAIRGRANVSATVTDWLEVGLNSQYSNRNESFLGANVTQAERVSPLGSRYEEDGTLKWYPHNDRQARNPFLYTTESGRESEQTSNQLIANLDADVSLPFGFDYTLRWANDLDFNRDYLFNPSTTPFGEPAGEAFRSESTNYRWQLDNILKWNKQFAGIHEVETTFLYNVEVENYWSTSANNTQFALESLGYSGLPTGSNATVGANDTRSTGTALMGRLNYRLLDRYLLTATYRRDGYSAFGQEQPYAYFPSVAVAWRLSEEPFFDVGAVSNLKLRASWGKNGNRSIGTYSALQRLQTNKYLYDGETVTGIYANNLPNPNLKWERTTQYNAGIDFGLFDGRFSGTLNAYYSSTSNLLLSRQLPDVTSFPSITTNLGEVVNRGIEASLTSANIQQDDLGWNSTLTFSANRNEIKSLYGTGEDDTQNEWFLGRSLSTLWDYEVLGVWQEDQAEQAAIYGQEPGDFRLRDVNGDSLLTPLEDKVFQGHDEPRFRVSLGNEVRFQNFTVSALLNAHLGQKRTNNVRQHTGPYYGRHNQTDTPYWTPDNPTNEWARLGSNDGPGFNYWENSSFVRLQNLSVSYDIPDALTNRLAGSNFSIFFNAQNVFVLTGYDGADPETGGNTPRVYSMGVNLAF